MSNKKTIHRDKLTLYSRGEGLNKYIEDENRRMSLYNARRQREEEEERIRNAERIEEARKKFIDEYKKSKIEDISEYDIRYMDALRRMAIYPYYSKKDFDGEENLVDVEVPSGNWTQLRKRNPGMEAYYAVKNKMSNEGNREDDARKTALSLLSEYENKFDANLLYEKTGVNPTIGSQYLYNQIAIQIKKNLDKVSEKPEEYLDYVNNTKPDSDIVNLNIQDSLSQLEQQYLQDSTTNIRDTIIKDTITRYTDFLANQEFDKKNGLVQKPEGYGFWSSQWWNDATGTYLTRLNETQAENFLGRIDVSNERLTRAQNAVKYLDALDIRKHFDNLLKSGQRLNAEQIKLLEQAQKDSQEFAGDYRYIQSLIPGTGILGLGDVGDDVASFINKNMSPGQDYGAEWYDYNNLLRRELRGIDSTDRDTRHKVLDRFTEETKKYQKLWANGAKVNFDEAETAKKKYNVSQWYKQQEGLVSDDFLDLDSWMYKQAGLAGASQSSALKSWTATTLNLIAGGLLKGIGKRVVAGAITMPMSISASQEENFAEVSENYKQRLKSMLQANGEYDNFIKEASEKLGLKYEEAFVSQEVEDEIFRQFQLGNFIPTSKKQLEITKMASYGLGALFQSDMMATTFDDIFNTAIELTPLGHLSKASKAGRFVSSTVKGSTLGPAGMLASLTADKVAKSSIGKAISKRYDGLVQFAKDMPEKLLGKKAAERVLAFAGKGSIPHRVLGELGYARYATVKEIAKGITKRAGVSAIGEGGEEGSQYLAGQRYQRGEYDDQEYMGFFNGTRIINNMYDMAKSAYVMAGFPLFLNLTDDDELIANIKGGMKGGFMQTGGTTTLQSAIPLYNQIMADNFVYKNVLLEKTLERDFWEKGIMFAKKATGGVDIGDINRSFDHLIAAVNRQGKSKEDVEAMQQLLEDQRSTALEIFRTANSKLAKDAAKANNIEYNTERYHQFVSLLSLVNQQGAEALKKLRAQNNIVDKMIMDLESPYTIEQGTGNVIDQRIRKHTGDILQSYVQPELDKDGKPILGEELAQQADAGFRAITSIAANIAALTQIKNDLESSKQNNTQFAQSKRDIDFLLKRVQKNIEENLKLIRADKQKEVLENAEQLLNDIQNNKELIDATRLNMLYQFEVDYFDSMVGGILGKYGKPQKGSEEAKRNLPYSQFNANDVIDDILKSIDNDYLLSQRIERDWQNTSQARSEVSQAIVESKLKKEAKKQARLERKKQKQNRPESQSPDTERTETGKFRKKRKSLQQKREENQQKKQQKEIKKSTQPTPQQGPQLSQLENQIQSQPENTVEAPIESQKQPVTIIQQEQPKPLQNAPKQPQKQSEGSTIDRGAFASAEDKQRYDALEEQLRKKMFGQMSSGIDPEILTIGMQMAYLRLKGGVVHFAEFAQYMVEKFGEGIKPYLKGMYDGARRLLEAEGFDTSTMTSIDDVTNFDVDHFNLPDNNSPQVQGGQQPTGEEGDNQAAVDRAFATDAQKTAYNKLEERATRESENVNINLRTGHDYFITVNGKLVMYGRVHDYLVPQYKPNPEEVNRERKVIAELNEAYIQGFAKFKEVAEKFTEEFNNEFKSYGGFETVDVSTYLKYIQDNPQEAGDVIEAIANLVSRIPPDNSVIIGRLVDGICRLYFSGKPVTYSAEVSKLIQLDAFNKLIEELAEIKQHYDALGWKLFADPMYLYTEFYDTQSNRSRRIAGETDMIAVDKDGHYHIVDFKTSYQSYADKKTPNGKRDNNLDHLGFVALNDERTKVRSTRQYYTDQQTAYMIMLRNSLAGSFIDSIELLPFKVEYEFYWNSTLTSLGKSISRVFTDKDHAPVYGIHNKTTHLDGNNEYIKNPDGTLKIDILRVQLSPSSGMMNRLLTADQIDTLKAILDSVPSSALIYLNSLSEEDRGKVKIENVTAAQENERLRTLYINSNPSTIADWETTFKNLERVVDDARSIIAHIDLDIAESQSIPEYTEKENLLIDELFDDEMPNFINTLSESFRLEVGQLYKLLMKIYYKGAKSVQDISAQELGDVDQMIANIEWLLQAYPQLSELKPQVIQYYNSCIKYFEGIVGPYTPKQPPREVLEKNFIEETDPVWRHMTTTWKKTLEGSVGIEDSVALDDHNMKLLQVTANPDFITDSIFELKIIPVTYNGHTFDRLHVIVHYKGHEYSPVSIHTAENNTNLYRAVKSLQSKNPGRKIILQNNNVHRTNGRIIAGQLGTVQNKGLVNNFFDIEYSSNQKKFAITRVRKNPKTQLNEVVAIVPGMDGGHKTELYNYGSNTAMRSGMLVMISNPTQNEHSDSKNLPIVPINMVGKRLAENDAKLILDILRLNYVMRGDEMLSRDMLDREFYENGMGKGFTCKQILRMLIPYGGRIHENMRVLHIAYDNATMNIVHIYGYVRGEEYEYNEDGSINDKDHPFDISTADGQQKFIEFITNNVNFNIDERLLAPKLNAAISESHPFYGLKKFQQTPSGSRFFNEGKTLTFGNSSIMFDLSDFRDKNDPTNNIGLSGLGYFLKRGFIQTPFNGFENTLLSFDDNGYLSTVSDISEAKPKVQQTVQQQMQESQILNNPVEQEISELGGVDFSAENNSADDYLVLDKTVFGSNEKQKLDSEKKVRKHLHRMFGRQGVPFKIIDDVIEVLSSGANVVGRCYADALLLSKQAERGTEYHEAFHRVAEILMPEKERNRLYDNYRRAKGIPIPKNKKQRETSDKQIREDIADAFMYYMSGAPKFKTSKLIHMFSYIKEWVDWYKNLGSFKLFWFYTQVGVLGKFKNAKAVAENRNKFATLYKNGLNAVIHNHQFEHILNSHMYRELRKTIVYAVLDANKIDPAGRNIQDLKLDKDLILQSKILKFALEDKNVPQSTKDAMKELVDNWDIIADDIARDISNISTDYMRRFELENEEDAESMEDAEFANIEQHIKASYQFSQFHRTSSLVRFFFARIPQADFKKIDGKNVLVARLNRLGLPQYMDVEYVFNSVLNKLHDIESKSELLERFAELSTTDPMYKYLYDKLNQLAKSSKTNVDDQQLFTQIYNILKSAKQEFELAKSVTNSQNERDITIQTTSSEYAAKNYKREWSDMFFSGGSLFVKQDVNGRVVMNEKFRPKIFNSIAVRLSEIRYAFSDESELPNAAPAVIGGNMFNRIDENHIEGVKKNLILILNQLGIQFDKSMLDYMLIDKYGDTGYRGMKQLLSSSFGGTSSVSSFETFIKLIDSLYVNGKLSIDENNQFVFKNSVINVDKIFEGKGSSFVSELSTYKYNYRHQHDQLSVLATKNNRFYVISENNLITDTTQDLNRAFHGWSESVEDGMNFDYNLFQPGSEDEIDPYKPAYGSVIYKDVLSVRSDRMLAPNVKVVTLAGFKSDEPGDIGEDYAEISQREDYISKFAILLDGGLIFPTMSDKKTWTYLRGINLPGIDYKRISDTNYAINQFRPDGSISQLDSVVRQIWEYTMCERKAIGSCLREMNGYVDSQGIEHPKMADQEKIDNYHGVTVKIGDKEINVIQGARFTSLLGVYNEDGEYVEFNRVLDEDGNIMSEEDNIKIADKEFFNPKEIVDQNTGETRLETEDELYKRQLSMIEEVFQKQLIDELSYIESLGLIERDANLSDRPSIEQYRNIGLPSGKLKAIARKLTKNYDSLTGAEKTLYDARAISVLVNDAMVKHVMSIEEVERVFSGHPAFFKFKYDNKGHLVDRTTDQHKRLGGLVSTGQNNDLELGLPTYYTQAEVDNEMIGSEDIEDITNLMMEGELRATYLRHMLDREGITMDEQEDHAAELARIADTIQLEDIQKNIPKTAYDIAVKLAEQKAAKFKKGIDVADGAAYMTDEMCENLLKMVGMWNSEVRKAFEILRGASPSRITEQQDAYNLVWTSVIGAQKYTAYGFRHQRGVQVPYYNKMALFPLFKCICTGNMAKIFNKMKTDRMDILCVKSAVKVGGQGSKSINWQDYNDQYTFEENFHFNTYRQKYSYLRKQFNTDPKESDTMHIGTQMMKVALSTLMAGREYIMNNGQKMSATEVRDSIMDCINKLSDIGLRSIHDEFFRDEQFDVEKFSKFLTKELISRNASQEMIDAVNVVTGKDGKPHFKMPLAAMSNLNFVQSILVSKINKQVVDVNTPGAAFIQRSVWGMEGVTRVLGDQNMPKDLYGGRRLKMVNEEGSMDCVVSIDFFDDIIPRDKNGKRLSFDEAKQWLIDNGIISGVKTGETKWSNAKANFIGYRIPTQAISSIHALRCVDVIPAVRDTVILPREFTRITGSDKHQCSNIKKFL